MRPSRSAPPPRPRGRGAAPSRTPRRRDARVRSLPPPARCRRPDLARCLRRGRTAPRRARRRPLAPPDVRTVRRPRRKGLPHPALHHASPSAPARPLTRHSDTKAKTHAQAIPHHRRRRIRRQDPARHQIPAAAQAPAGRMEVRHPGAVAVPSFRHADRAGRRGLPDPVPAAPAVQGARVRRARPTTRVYRSIESAHSSNTGVHQDIQRQLPEPRYVKVDVTKGAGQFRAVGRAVALASTKEIASAARRRDRPPRRRIGTRRAADPRPAAPGARRGRRRQPHGHRHLLGRRRVGGGPVPRHHRGRQVDGEAASVVEPVLQHPVRPRRLRPAQCDRRHAGQRARRDRRDDERLLDEFAVRVDARAPQEPGRRAVLRQMRWTESAPPTRSSSAAATARSPSRTRAPVYNAVATSLTAWITDERVQDDMIAYSSGNWQARVGANVLARRLGPCQPRAPLAAVLLDGLRTGHPRARAVPRVLRRAIRALGRSIGCCTPTPKATRSSRRRPSASGSSRGPTSPTSASSTTCSLNEETESHNQVIDALRADEHLAQIKAELDHGVDQRLSEGGSRSTSRAVSI